MRISNNKNRTIFVASVSGAGGSDQCPRLILIGKNVRFRDDYSGSIKAKGRLLNSLFAF